MGFFFVCVPVSNKQLCRCVSLIFQLLKLEYTMTEIQSLYIFVRAYLTVIQYKNLKNSLRQVNFFTNHLQFVDLPVK